MIDEIAHPGNRRRGRPARRAVCSPRPAAADAAHIARRRPRRRNRACPARPGDAGDPADRARRSGAERTDFSGFSDVSDVSNVTAFADVSNFSAFPDITDFTDFPDIADRTRSDPHRPGAHAGDSVAGTQCAYLPDGAHVADGAEHADVARCAVAGITGRHAGARAAGCGYGAREPVRRAGRIHALAQQAIRRRHAG